MYYPDIKTGQKVRFDPFRGIKGYGVDELRHNVTGKVFYVNRKHGWFGVAYGPGLRTGYRFTDVSGKVRLIT